MNTSSTKTKSIVMGGNLTQTVQIFVNDNPT
jgi:hypothetical protein